MQQYTEQQINTRNITNRNKYIILAIVMTGTLMAVLDGIVVNIALPTITAHFSAGLARSQWTIMGYLLAMTGLLIFFGKISDYTGKVRLFIAGWALFTASSLACGMAPGLGELIAFRVAQGIGASMVTAVSGAIVFLAFPPQEQGKATAFFGIVAGVGALIGPGLGGVIVDHLGWQYLFFINVPVGIVLVACALKYLRVPEPEARPFAVDWIGAGALFLSVVSLLLLSSELSNNLAVTWALVACGALFAASSAIFVARESRCEHPLLDISIFLDGRFVLPIVSMMLMYAGVNMANVLAPFYFQHVMGYTPTQMGLMLMIVPLLMMITAPVSGKLYDRHHWKFQAGASMLVTAAAIALLCFAFATASLGLIAAAFVIWGVGSGFFGSPNYIEAMTALPIEKAAIASSISSTAMGMGLAIGVSLASVLMAAAPALYGYHGDVFAAGQPVLAGSMGLAMLAAAVICLLSGAASAMRNI